jgi:hypothetical protein
MIYEWMRKLWEIVRKLVALFLRSIRLTVLPVNNECDSVDHFYFSSQIVFCF